MCEGVGDVVAGVAEVLGQTLNGLGAAGQGLHSEADESNLHSNRMTSNNTGSAAAPVVTEHALHKRT